jgi:hypothetical protein
MGNFSFLIVSSDTAILTPRKFFRSPVVKCYFEVSTGKFSVDYLESRQRSGTRLVCHLHMLGQYRRTRSYNPEHIRHTRHEVPGPEP